ncbi:hypothetical protein AAFF_G00085400 [Aldrovandia affinis]|uniref:J domain-containing protein n=1 Tax=Aldrovandia affinis TaxID=143900 RepID=A0AAD7WCL0_9TELE|nr:hypothetical protein AAFF_G00085400 [Aldrovandia affinis]
MGLLAQCEELFETPDLYEVLGVAREASEAEVRRGYYRVSLLVHPDRAREDRNATEKFQVLGRVYSVLSDVEQRAVYDEQGAVTLADILEFEKKYRGSEEEMQDVSQLYLQHEGDMDAITASALCCSQEDEPRLARLIQGAIDAGELPAFRAFTHESDRKKRARQQKADEERREAEEAQKEMGAEAEDSLVQALKQRQKSRELGFESFLSDLEAKYSKKGGKAGAGKRGKK